MADKINGVPVDQLDIITKNWVGSLTLWYDRENCTVAIYHKEGDKAILTMDQADSLSTILWGWVRYAQETGRTVANAR